MGALTARIHFHPSSANWYTPLPKSGKHGNALVRMFPPSPSELGYLSWGRRYYGEPPLPPRTHEGWHYFVVLQGTPILTMNGKEIETPPRLVSIGDPECALGHSDRPGRSCQMLTWIWRSPPSHSALRPPRGGALRLELGAAQVRRLQQLHRQCREAVADPNERGLLQLRAARLLIDLTLLQAREHHGEPDDATRIALAIEYLRHHVADASAVTQLCEYLQMSRPALTRLFRRHTGKNPRAFAQDVRMQWAREQLAERSTSVKSVGFALGYRHLADFSRAFKNHFGVVASDVGRPGSGPSPTPQCEGDIR
ncbi:MAG TPA: AraC family transcriptional regulator [Opitutaceae bacterium]|jgi:AraC-like DNA-binding protein|nr:AraC family transcriptional regulator [Opitutaceae bacterium]